MPQTQPRSPDTHTKKYKSTPGIQFYYFLVYFTVVVTFGYLLNVLFEFWEPYFKVDTILPQILHIERYDSTKIRTY